MLIVVCWEQNASRPGIYLSQHLLSKLSPSWWRCVSLCSWEYTDPWSFWVAIFWPSTLSLVSISFHVGISVLNPWVTNLLLIQHTYSCTLCSFLLSHLASCSALWALSQTSRVSHSSTFFFYFLSKAGSRSQVWVLHNVCWDISYNMRWQIIALSFPVKKVAKH